MFAFFPPIIIIISIIICKQLLLSTYMFKGRIFKKKQIHRERILTKKKKLFQGEILCMKRILSDFTNFNLHICLQHL